MSGVWLASDLCSPSDAPRECSPRDGKRRQTRTADSNGRLERRDTEPTAPDPVYCKRLVISPKRRNVRYFAETDHVE